MCSQNSQLTLYRTTYSYKYRGEEKYCAIECGAHFRTNGDFFASWELIDDKDYFCEKCEDEAQMKYAAGL